MDKNRLPKLCFNRLMNLTSQPDQNAKFNGALQIQNLMENIYCKNLFVFENIRKSDITATVDMYSNLMLKDDKNRAKCSGFSHLYQSLQLSRETQSYLMFPCSISFGRVLAHLRSSCKYSICAVIRRIVT